MGNKLEILIATDCNNVSNKVISSLGDNNSYNQVCSFEEVVEVISQKTIDLFYIDFDLFLNKTYKIVENIKNDIKCSLNPICLLSSNTDKFFREQMYSLGIKDLLIKPFFEKEVLNSFNKIYEDSGKFKSSLTNKTINSLVKLHSCESISFVLENRARLYSRDIELNVQEARDLSTLAKFISLGVSTLPLKKLINYFEDMGLAKELKRILTDKPSENKLTAILYSLYEQERIFHGKQEKELLAYGENYKIYDELLARYTKNEYKISDFLEYKYITSIIKDKLSEKSLSQEIFKNMNVTFEKIVKHTILYNGGCNVVIVDEDENFLPSLKIEPFDNRVLINQNILTTILPINRDKLTLKKSKIKTRNVYSLELIAPKKEKTVKVEVKKEEESIEEPLFLDFDEHITESNEDENRVLISAEEFLNHNDIDFDDINILIDYENEIFDVLDVLEYEENPIKHVGTAYEVLQKYMSRLIYYIEFKGISDSISELAEAINSYVDESIEKKRLLNAFVLIESIMKNLRTWREKIFVEQDTPDIHFLDNSIKADCHQLVTFIKPAEENDDDLELF